MPAVSRSDYPLFTLDVTGVAVCDLQPAQDAIRRKYGPRYHVSEHALWDCAALWGIAPTHHRINDCGVFDLFDEAIEFKAGRCRAEIKLAATPSGLCTMGTSHILSMSGAGSAPSVWNRIAFHNLDDARAAGLAEHRARFSRVVQSGSSDSADARKFLEQLDDAATPQLALF
ncbi:MAG: hypothetical protein AAFV69_14475 [Pseudomonadota bacterium]